MFLPIPRPRFFPCLDNVSLMSGDTFSFLTPNGDAGMSPEIALTCRTRKCTERGLGASSQSASERKIGLYCSNVSAALDHVSTQKLVDKISRSHVHSAIARVLASWPRTACGAPAVGRPDSATSSWVS